MSAQLGLELTAPFVRHSSTSKDAAEQIKPNAGTLRAKVLEYLQSIQGFIYSETFKDAGSYGGATDEQMQRCIPMEASTQRPRRIELVAAGLVRDSGRKAQTSSGRKATVWEVVR